MSNQEYEVIPYEGHEILFDGTTAYMTQAQMADLLGVSVKSVNKILQNAHRAGLVDLGAVIHQTLITAADGKSYRVNLYPTKAILLVGFRVKQATPRALAFQEWVTRIVEGYLESIQEEKEHLERENARLLDHQHRQQSTITDLRRQHRTAQRQGADSLAQRLGYFDAETGLIVAQGGSQE